MPSSASLSSTRTHRSPRPAAAVDPLARSSARPAAPVAAHPRRAALVIGLGLGAAAAPALAAMWGSWNAPRGESFHMEKRTPQDRLVDELKDLHRISTPQAETALRAADRGLYAGRGTSMMAYADMPQTIGYGQTISAPHMHAHCIDVLAKHLSPGAQVLDVGSGSGYLCAAFARLVAPPKGRYRGKVVGIDNVPELVEWSIENLRGDTQLGGKLLQEGVIEVHCGDGWEGWLPGAPYDAIHVGAAADEVPPALLKQLAPGGRLVMPVGPRFGQRMWIIDKDARTGALHTSQSLSVNYVPLVKQRKLG